MGYIDTSGKVVIAAIYDEVSNFSNGVAMVKSNNEYFQIDTKRRAQPIRLSITEPTQVTVLFPLRMIQSGD